MSEYSEGQQVCKSGHFTDVKRQGLHHSLCISLVTWKH